MTDQQNDNGQLLPKIDDTSSLPISDNTSSASSSDIDPAVQAVRSHENEEVNTEAGDVDIIEKAWIDKAKHIVDQTSSDPFEQQKMISKVKADYIKKRFNKDIKIDSE